MSGKLITMAGPSDVTLSSLSNFEAGLATLGLIARVYPGITFGKLASIADGQSEVMAGWLTDIGKVVGNVKDGIGDVLKDTASAIGGGVGGAVRLVTDEKVIDGASRLGTAYATSGGSEGAKGFLDTLGSGGQSVIDFISSLGATAKNTEAAADGGLPGGALPWVLGLGAGALVLVMVARK